MALYTIDIGLIEYKEVLMDYWLMKQNLKAEDESFLVIEILVVSVVIL